MTYLEIIERTNLSKTVGRLNGYFVVAYKLAGFAVLSAILIGTAAYFAAQIFFSVSDRWLVPTIVSPTDERVLRLRTQVADQTYALDRQRSERMSLEAELERIDGRITVEEEFQAEYRITLEADIAARNAELARLARLRRGYAYVRGQIASSDLGLKDVSRARLRAARDLRLKDTVGLLEANYQLAQLQGNGLELEQKHGALLDRGSELERSVESLQFALYGKETGATRTTPNYEGLEVRRRIQESRIVLSAARREREAVASQIAGLDRAIEEHARLVELATDAPYYRASQGRLAVAFAPYENREKLGRGEDVYACALGFFWCHRVGQLAGPLDGEVSNKHPIRNQIQRGVLVEIEMAELDRAEDDVLFVGRPPLLL